MKHRMVDRIVAWEPWRNIRGMKAVSFEEYCIRSPLGESEQLPATLVLESLLQLGEWLIIVSSDFTQIGLPQQALSVEFHDALRPGERITIEVTIGERCETDVVLSGVGHVDARSIVNVEGCRLILHPLEQFHSPADLQVLCSQIGPEPNEVAV